MRKNNTMDEERASPRRLPEALFRTFFGIFSLEARLQERPLGLII